MYCTCSGFTLRIAQRIGNAARGACTPSSGGEVMVRIAAHAKTNQLGVDGRPTRLGVLQFFQHQRTGTIGQHKAITVFVPRTTGLAGSSLRVDNARAAPKPPMPRPQAAISAPPATITSASLQTILRAAMPMQWVPVVQAVAIA